MTDQGGNSVIRRIVVGVDGSASALDAVRWAAREAHMREIPLTLVHALHLPDASAAPLEPDDFAERQQEAGLELLGSAAALVAASYPELKIESESTPGAPVHRLVELSSPDTLVVTGSRGHGGFLGMLLGSVSRALAGHAEGPLAVVRGSEHDAIAGPADTAAGTRAGVADPMDGSVGQVDGSVAGPAIGGDADGPVVLGLGAQAAWPAIEFAFETARRYGTSVRAVRAWWPTIAMAGAPAPGAGVELYAAPGFVGAADPQDSGELEAAWAEQAIAPVRARYPDVAVEIRAVAGNAVPVLSEQSEDARLVVVGAHRRRLLFSVGAGYVVEGLLSHCPTPVAVIPVHATDEGDDRDGVDPPVQPQI